MIVNTILFDLDGTLTDPKLGITRCIQYALSELGYQSPDAEELHWCIGPPLKDSFSQLLKTSDIALVEKALSLYRSRFSTIGLFENLLYPQIVETLKVIKFAGYKTFVATSKPQVYATRIIKYFSLSLLFDGIYGSEFDGTRSAKADLISHILLAENLSPSSVVMVGDRQHDIIGAKRNHIAAIGVTYGYGTEEELKTHGADFIAHCPENIPELIIHNF
ncbi:HAD family hydrolase [Nostoc linckia z18]|uniref:HAD family hydrolase n=2 Tax=Nostoc linckia TaxID=92942 RepID=A0A9Q6EMG0_NOSLI|nr:HAD family hydrolase [Nostoc linckia]PHK40108.1 HAD family hydrolase [Nostoc linckia z15]PHK46242.1 HAD family hydrolase [Nostoc linckia z16]PHJ66497.1 HAD family hydrolase [Nostoc linckia z1]PHJ71371.1 HAD family hydrolase [Nostoc linckia z3]PHJ75403.1 HAD family hydrolase [Nostoc linckia z2]